MRARNGNDLSGSAGARRWRGDTRSWSLSSSPRLDALGTEIGVSYVHKASQSLAFDLCLPEGFEYTVARRLDWLAITWVAIPIPG
jgi:hypothetical protein